MAIPRWHDNAPPRRVLTFVLQLTEATDRAPLRVDSRAHRAAREASGLSQGLPPGARGDDASKASRSLCFPRHWWDEYARRQRAASDPEDARMARWEAVDELADGTGDSGDAVIGTAVGRSQGSADGYF
jgi:hypothetical protein